MSLNWPASPSIGQLFTAPNGQVWVWDGTKWVGAAGVPPALSANNAGRNYIHNPYFNIQQRGVGTFNVSGGYTADRWAIGWGTGDAATVNLTPIADAGRAAIGDESAKYMPVIAATGGSAAGSYVLFNQPIESVRRLSNQTVIVSFWALAGTGTPKVGVSIDQAFGTGGSPSGYVSGVGKSVTISTTWTRYSMTFAVPSTSGKTLGTNGDDKTWLNLWLSSGSTNNSFAGGIGVQSATFYIWGVQLEVAAPGQTQPTPLEHIDPGLDLRNCQRFYQMVYPASYVWCGDGNAYNWSHPFATTMRATPTLDTSGVSWYGQAQAGGYPVLSANSQVVQSTRAAATPGLIGLSGTIKCSADL